MRVLVHGDDLRVEGALRDRGLEPIRDAPADSLLTMAPAPVLRPLTEIGAEEWKARFDACVADAFWAFPVWLRDVLARGATGRWVAISGVLGSQPFPDGGADGAFAVALQTLVRIAAIEYGPHGIRANAIAAGWREQTLPDELDGRLAVADTPTDRLVSARDIAASVAWLLSRDAEQLNGEILHLDGGYTITRAAGPVPAMKVDEVAPGIHRIESDVGPRFVAQYVLVGAARTLLVDTGLAGTPDQALLPALEQAGVEPDLIVVSHADVDHWGGNRRIRERYPSATFACHELDRRWIESNAAMLAENYLWHEPYGLDVLDEQGRQEMLTQLGGDAPIDLGLRGGETIRLEASRRLEVLHLPGHSPGHIGLWDLQQRVAIIIDAVLYDGIYDRAGAKLIPPRYYDAAAYRKTIRRVRALEPELLLTAHFEPMSRAAAIAFATVRCSTSMPWRRSCGLATRPARSTCET